ncbi:unnamed protein product, partial [Allacma fusca]
MGECEDFRLVDILSDSEENESIHESSGSSKEVSFKSTVYKNFTLDSTREKFKCNHCSAALKKDKSGSTSNLRKHITRKHTFVTLNESSGTSTKKSKDITDYLFKPEQFDQEEFENLMLNMIILTDQPMTLCDREAFRDFAMYGHKNVKIPSCSTIKRKLFERYETQKIELINKLQAAPGKISLV